MIKSIPVYDIAQFHSKGGEKFFYANLLSAHESVHGYIKMAHKHNFYSSMLVTSGSGTHTIDFKTFQVKPGYVFLMHPGQVHKYELSADIEGYKIFHTKAFYNQYFTHEKVERLSFFQVGSTPLIILQEPLFPKIEAIFRDLLKEYESEQIMKFDKICSLLNVLYISLSQLYPLQKNKISQNHRKQLKDLEEFIEKNYKNMKSAGQYAELMKMGPKNLNRIVKLNLDKTTSQLIDERIVLEAKRMLIHSDLTISQIAFELGYTDNPYFYRVFKKKIGETPTEFRKKFRSN
jgi:AraC-like DNA-binding protein/mannose-6-phosphate isomerase-like protein (cupin superfamily)